MRFSLVKHLSNYQRKLDFLKIFNTYGETAGLAFYTLAHVAFAFLLIGASVALISNGQGADILMKTEKVNEAVTRWEKNHISNKFANYEFTFKQVGDASNTQREFTLSPGKINGGDQTSGVLSTNPQSLNDVSKVFPQLAGQVTYTQELVGKSAMPICMNLDFRTKGGEYKNVMLQDLCIDSRDSTGLSFIAWKHETLNKKDLGCESSAKCSSVCSNVYGGEWNDNSVSCTRFLVAKEVCGMVFPGETDVAYLGGCFNKNEPVRYEILNRGETFDPSKIQITLRHPADPYVTAVRTTSDGSVFVPRTPEELSAGSPLAKLFLTLSAIIFAVLFAFAYVVKRKQKYIALKVENSPRPNIEFPDMRTTVGSPSEN